VQLAATPMAPLNQRMHIDLASFRCARVLRARVTADKWFVMVIPIAGVLKRGHSGGLDEEPIVITPAKNSVPSPACNSRSGTSDTSAENVG